jgi:hypothetical protein
MSSLETLRDYRFSSDIDDVRGANIYGRDLEVLGTIADVIFDRDTGYVRYAIVDTGGWLESRKFLVPAEQVQPHPENREEFLVDLTREQVQQLPVFSEELIESEDRWREYEQKFSDVALWPPVAIADSSAAALRSPMGTPPEVAGSKTTAEVRRRWAIFQESLKRDRERLRAEAPAPAEPASAEDLTQKKAS